MLGRTQKRPDPIEVRPFRHPPYQRQCFKAIISCNTSYYFTSDCDRQVKILITEDNAASPPHHVKRSP
jgi:hypothetical protein